MRRVLLAALMALACAEPASAENTEPTAASLASCVSAAGSSRLALEACVGVISDPCIGTDGGETTGGTLQCYRAEGAAWTAELEAAVARATEDEARRPWLGPAQDAWIAWRDAECAYRASLALGGSMARVLSAACLAELTAARAIDFIHAERNED
jgi:uncharacterized protein YecT (DUF1311 family)